MLFHKAVNLKGRHRSSASCVLYEYHMCVMPHPTKKASEHFSSFKPVWLKSAAETVRNKVYKNSFYWAANQGS